MKKVSQKNTITEPKLNYWDAEKIEKYWASRTTEMETELEKERVANDWPDYGKYENIIVNELCYEVMNYKEPKKVQEMTMDLFRYFIINFGNRDEMEFHSVKEKMEQIGKALEIFNPKFDIDINILRRLHEVLKVWLLDKSTPSKYLIR
jgi:hypothetical protein